MQTKKVKCGIKTNKAVKNMEQMRRKKERLLKDANRKVKKRK